MAKKRLLIIDTEPTTRWALRNYFESRGARIDAHKVMFNSGVRAPVSTSLAAR